MLTLNDSRAKDISHGAKTLKLTHHSSAERIALGEVEDLHVEDSHVKEMTIVVAKNSTIKNSELKDIKRMQLVGDSVFQVQDSNISTIRALHYTSTSGDSVMNDVNVGRVFSRGIIINNGFITMENVTFENLDSNAIVVSNGSRVLIRNSVISNALPDSWIIENGFTEFVDVLVNNKHNFNLKTIGSPLNPLRLVIDCPTSPLYWMAPVITVSALLLGFLVGGGVIFIVCGKRFSFSNKKPNGEEMSALTKTSGKKAKDGALNQVATTNTSSPPPSQKGSLEEYYELYEDVQNEGPKLPPPGNTRGFFHKPSPQTTGPKRNAPPQTSMDDDNGELYEDVSDINTSHTVQAPPSRGKPVDSYPKLPHSTPPPFPQSSSPFSGSPSLKLGPPLPTRNPPSPLAGNLVQDKGNINSRPPAAIPYDPSKFSVQSSSSSVPDEGDNLSPLPAPQDDQEFYDDTDSILPNSQSKHPLPSDNKPSFLHNHTPSKPNVPVKPFSKPKPLGGMLGKFASKKSPPRVPLENPVPPSNQNDDDDDEEAVYEEI